MPIHDLGYRSLGDHPRNLSFRWLIIASQGMRLAWKNAWIRRLIYLVFVPTMLYGILIFLFEYYVGLGTVDRQEAMFRQVVRDMLRNAALPDDVRLQLGQNPESARYYVWTYLLLSFLRGFQQFHLTIMIGMVAPPLISQDLLRKTFVLYFSRPIRRIDYVFGKLSVIWGYGLLLTTVPALSLFLVGTALSPDLSVLEDTWEIPIRILVASSFVLVPTALVALVFSSFTTSSRYAAFAWFAIWIVGFVSYFITSLIQRSRSSQKGDGWHPDDDSLTYFLSPYETLGRIQEWALDVRPFSDVQPAVIVVSIVTVTAFAILYRRVYSPLRA